MTESKLRYIARKLCQRLDVPLPSLWLVDELSCLYWKMMPSSYLLNLRGHGCYRPDDATIVIELLNPRTGKKYPDQAIIHCFAHEFVHHLEKVKLGSFYSHRGKFASWVRKIKKLIKELNAG